jgi:hypothetical protein
MHLFFYDAKVANLKLKTQAKQLFGLLPFDIALPDFLSLPI